MGEGFSGWYVIAVMENGDIPGYMDAAWAVPVRGYGGPTMRRWCGMSDGRVLRGFASYEDAGAFARRYANSARYERIVTADDLATLIAMWRAQQEAERWMLNAGTS